MIFAEKSTNERLENILRKFRQISLLFQEVIIGSTAG